MTIRQQDILFAWDASHGIVPTVGGSPNEDIRGGDKWVRTRAQGGSPLYTKRVGNEVPFSWVERDGVLLPRRTLDRSPGRTPVNDDSVDLSATSDIGNDFAGTITEAESAFAGQTGYHWDNDTGSFDQGIASVGVFSGGTEVLTFVVEEDPTSGGPVAIGIWDGTAAAWVAHYNINFGSESLGVNQAAGDAGYFVRESFDGPNGQKTARVHIVYTGTAGNNRSVRAQFSDGERIYFHHWQLEEAHFASSPIVYTGSPVTRPADVVRWSPGPAPQDAIGYLRYVIAHQNKFGGRQDMLTWGDDAAVPKVEVREMSDVENAQLLLRDGDNNFVDTKATLPPGASALAPGDLVEIAFVVEIATGRSRALTRVNEEADVGADGGTPASWVTPTDFGADNRIELAGPNGTWMRGARLLMAKPAALDADPWTGAGADVLDELADVPIGPHRAGLPG